jgi:hypothetical protein
VWVRFAPDGKSVALVSPCRLDGTPPFRCEDPDLAARWRQYQLPLEGGPLKLVRADLPPGAVLHPAGNKYAWVAGGSACVGEPADQAARCWPLPASH